LVFKAKAKAKERARFAPSSMMVFVSNPFEPVTFSSAAKKK
jgi:hypothetical protein